MPIVGMDDEADKIETRRAQARERSRRWREANREKDRAKTAAWAKANPEKKRARDKRWSEVNRERLRAYQREYYRKRHPKKDKPEKPPETPEQRASRLERGRQWRTANRDRSFALQKRWRADNRETRRADKRSRKIAKRKTTIAELLKLQRGRCAICREKLEADIHIDHIMPRALGGSNARTNLQLACAPCNLAKNAMHPVDHARTLGRLI